jgi:hypothetical protein
LRTSSGSTPSAPPASRLFLAGNAQRVLGLPN